jgi:REP element-mobilizing transposase RayT
MLIVYGSRSMRWGGARAGAGRPAKGPIPSEPHRQRPHLAARHPVHVTARTERALSAIRRRRTYAALRRATQLSLARADFRIVHLAVLPHRVELIVEADNKAALARGMQGFQVSAARWLNREARRSGTAFPDRYKMRILKTRPDVRDAIGRLPHARSVAWPQTWLLRVDAAPRSSRNWFRTHADEDSS